MDGIHIKRGQWLRSYRRLAKDLEYKEKRGYKQYGLATIKRAIERLIKNGLVTVSDTEIGTLFTVVNYEEYQGVSGSSEHLNGTPNGTKSERHRNNNKNVENVKKKDIDQPSGRSKNSYPNDFEEFWSIYPKKVGKPKAFSCWKARIKKESKDNLIKAVQNYAKHCELEETLQKFIKHPSTFLGPNLDYQDWIEYKPEQPKNNVVSFEDKREKARNENADRQIAINRWIQATDRDPDDNFKKWFEEGAKVNELHRYIT